ncbi:hypothetical protein KIL84_013457 [Mauremys mutica]|uniref:Uncharacterized protein n=1 Tax=Mauremys mutica TaxID=74926 RepID=A0A9D4AN83_9SAUR|nr:hypothetical protein KIL84_013457 [Mauremys mutica]
MTVSTEKNLCGIRDEIPWRMVITLILPLSPPAPPFHNYSSLPYGLEAEGFCRIGGMCHIGHASPTFPSQNLSAFGSPPNTGKGRGGVHGLNYSACMAILHCAVTTLTSVGLLLIYIGIRGEFR